MQSKFGESFRASHRIWWGFIQDSWPGIAGLTGVVVIAVASLTPALTQLETYAAQPARGNLPAAVLLSVLAYVLVMLAVVLSVQVGVLRHARHGERLSPVINVLGMTGLRFGWRALVLSLVVLAAGLPAMLTGGLVAGFLDPLAGVGLAVLLSLIPVYVGIRLAPWQATFADREKTPLGRGWSVSAGAAWGIFWRAFLIPLPVLFLSSLLVGLVELVVGGIGFEGMIAGAILGVGQGLFGILPLALPFAVLAHLWSDLAGEPAGSVANNAVD